MKTACIQKTGAIAEIDATADLQAAGKRPQGSARRLLIARPEHDNVAPAKAVALVKLGVPGAGAFGDIVGAHLRRIIIHGAADDLFYFALMQIDARTKHKGSIEASVQSSRSKVHVAG